MKAFSILAILAALIALVVSQFSFEFSVSLLFVAGVAVMAIGDYRRPAQPLAAGRVSVSSRAQRLQLAA